MATGDIVVYPSGGSVVGTGTRTTVTVVGDYGNLDILRTRSTAALAANATFLAIASPTATQVATQAKALTRQNDAIIRIVLNLLSDISDT